MAGPAEGDADLAPRAFLVGLRAPERDDEPLPHALDVVAVEPHDFRSPEPAREADQEQRPVPRVLHALAHGVQDPEQVLSQQRLGFALGDPSVRLMPRIVARTISDRQGFGQPSRLVRLRDRVASRRIEGGDAERLACAAR